MVAHACHSSDGGKHKLGGSWSKREMDPIYKITRAKSLLSVAQVVESLSSKCKALSSNPSTDQERKKILGRLPMFIAWKN
jgi:Cdc6-like AAA superfamily ATPase